MYLVFQSPLKSIQIYHNINDQCKPSERLGLY
jgi:hypothetical protein